MQMITENNCVEINDNTAKGDHFDHGSIIFLFIEERICFPLQSKFFPLWVAPNGKGDKQIKKIKKTELLSLEMF